MASDGAALLFPYGTFGLVSGSREELARVLDLASGGTALLLPFSTVDFGLSYGADFVLALADSTEDFLFLLDGDIDDWSSFTCSASLSVLETLILKKRCLTYLKRYSDSLWSPTKIIFIFVEYEYTHRIMFYTQVVTAAGMTWEN